MVDAPTWPVRPTQGGNNFLELDELRSPTGEPRRRLFHIYHHPPPPLDLNQPLCYAEFRESSTGDRIHNLKMSFGGQTPTIIVLKEGEQYPTAATHNAHCCRIPSPLPLLFCPIVRGLTGVLAMQEPIPPRARARLFPTLMPVWLFRPR